MSAQMEAADNRHLYATKPLGVAFAAGKNIDR